MRVRSLGWEELLEEGMATHSSILAWRIPLTEGAWRATVYRVTKSWTQLKRLSTHVHTDCVISIAGGPGRTLVLAAQALDSASAF